jgi:enoyl-CoA hydratase
LASVSLEQCDTTALVTFDRPPVNAIDMELIEGFREVVEQLAASPPPGGLVLTGAGRAFSAGIDFKEVPRYAPEQQALTVAHVNAAVAALYGLPTCTVAAVNGHAIGGAAVMALACDVRLAADTDLKIGLTEVTAGIPYPACPIEIVRAEIEPSFRRHLVLSGELIDASEARAHGIVDELVAPDALVARAVELARVRAAASAYAQVKRQLKGAVLERMEAIVAGTGDPALGDWL